MKQNTITAAIQSLNRLTLNEDNISGGTLPPQSIEAEEAVLAALLLDPNAYRRVKELIPNAEYFSLGSHRVLYFAIAELATANKPTDIVTVSTWLNAYSSLELAGGTEKIKHLCDGVFYGSANVDYHAEIVADFYRRRQVIQLSAEYTKKAYDRQLTVPQLVGDYKTAVLRGLDEDGSTKTTMAISDILIDVFQEAEDAAEGKVAPAISTGFYDVDALFGCSFSRQTVLIIAGRPSMGKSSYMLNTIANIAKMTQKWSIIFSLEVSKKDMARKMLATLSGLSFEQIKSGKLSPQDWPRLTEAVSLLAELPIMINDAGGSQVSDIVSAYHDLADKVGADNINIVAVDYIQLMNAQRDYGGNANSIVSEISKGLHNDIAKKLNVGVIALSQLSRSVESRNNKRPILSDLRDSGSLEQDATIVSFLYRDEYYNPDTDDKGITEVIVAKNKNGPVGTAKLLFDARQATFRNFQSSVPTH